MIASDGWVLFLAKHVYKKRQTQKKGKDITETQTETLGTVIRLQHIFVRALTSSKALKTSHTVLTNVTDSPYEHWCQHFPQTVSSYFLIKKEEIFTKQKHKDCTLLTKAVCGSCFPWIFRKSQNGDEPNEHKLSHGPLSANTRWTQYILWPVRNRLTLCNMVLMFNYYGYVR